MKEVNEILIDMMCILCMVLCLNSIRNNINILNCTQVSIIKQNNKYFNMFN